MLISEFSRRVDLTVDTVRFYVRLGLLKPKSNGKGGSRPYQIFTADDVETVRLIRIQQMLGYSLRDIARLLDEYANGELTDPKIVDLLKELLCRLREQRDHQDSMMAYVSAKIEWVETARGSAPRFEDYVSVGEDSSTDKRADISKTIDA
ncbi:MerR family transcriptional regulator [Pseudomonas syringae pv. syringae]|uniref:MerR family transcriptional regulator n=1 Tax=Pseudomonas syringae TaxID=317 RepID=UPI0023F8B2CD|nr:MerR family transcriptional regulator [Pseudomonas syringae]MDF5890242.1 MerR family transcriptional regulator [Pseudomonas syringae pv. syringae]